jgi:hypothetical protein
MVSFADASVAAMSHLVASRLDRWIIGSAESFQEESWGRATPSRIVGGRGTWQQLR